VDHWNYCLARLESELPPQQFNTWIRPLQLPENQSSGLLQLFAPNAFVLDWVKKHYLKDIETYLQEYDSEAAPSVRLEIGSTRKQVEESPVKISSGSEKKPACLSQLCQIDI